MEDKKIYNRIMFIAFCLIVILLCSGMYSWFHGNEDFPKDIQPLKKSQVIWWEEGSKTWNL